MKYRLSIFVLWFALFQASLTVSAVPGPSADQLPEPYGQGSYISGKFGKIYYERRAVVHRLLWLTAAPVRAERYFGVLWTS